MTPERLRAGEDLPIEIARYLDATLEEGWSGWVPYLVHVTIEEQLGVRMNPLAQAKVFFIQDLRGDRRCLEDAFLFEKMVLTFAGMIPDFDVWQPPSTAAISYGLRALRDLAPDAELDDAVQHYIAAALLHDGCWLVPPGIPGVEDYVQAVLRQRGIVVPSQAEALKQFESGGSIPPDLASQRDVWRRCQNAVREYEERRNAA